ncbi:MAG: GNAT family N-acetyltransferase [Prevotellaceae bacterium]|nr:GNAT family N-acetyltransferase [Prevotellaceae bacterium]
MIELVPYSVVKKDEWDNFVSVSRTPTLLHYRDYMDYHSNRFQDASLIFKSRDKIMALLPACISRNNPNVIVSHEGLTYGGFILADKLHTSFLEEIFKSALNYYKETFKALQITIKPIPYIYMEKPCDEQLYLLHRFGATITGRNLSQAINLTKPVKMNTLRQRCIKKAVQNGIQVKEALNHNEWNDFHALLTLTLKTRHSVTPTHSADELWLLHTRFPKQIRLFVSYKHETMLAACVVYVSKNVAHTQYLASSVEGRKYGALDIIINSLISSKWIEECKYLDFGISTEYDGSLNYGLALQKEGFDGHGVCYDIYSLKL